MTTPPPVAADLDRVAGAVLADPAGTLLATDFDGVLAPIVADPEAATADPAAMAALVRVSGLVGRVVVITGRPVRTAVRLGALAGRLGLERLTVLGQYGVERWDAETDTYDIPPAPAVMTELEARLPAVLSEHGWPDAKLEHKGRALAVHTRQLADPRRAFDELSGPVTALAEELGLHTEPGKLVLEVRAPGMDKGIALRRVLAEAGARVVVYAGDDLGDMPAFHVVREWHANEGRGITVFSGPSEGEPLPELTELADVVVDGTAGIAAWLDALADRLEAG
ncbi:trehalose-phosphatase [Propionibacteriaceae bacterium Y2011]